MDDNLLSQPIDNPLAPLDEVVEESDPLKLDLKDETFIQVFDRRIKDSQRFLDSKYNLTTRRKTLEKYLFGRQLQDKKWKDYEAQYVDNLFWEIEQSIRSLAFSKLPDLTIHPGNPSDVARQEAEDLTKAVNSDLKKRELRKVASMAFRHHPVYFTGIVKVRWDPDMGEYGDIRFECVHPESVIVDHTAAGNDQAQMDYVAEAVELSVKEVLLRFPKKKDDFLSQLRINKVFKGGDENDETKLATKVKVWEIWFRWAKADGEKIERVIGTAWKYEQCVLMNIKNPNWDYEGGKRLITFDPSDTSTKQPVDEQAIRKSLILGAPIDNLQVEQIYYNYLEQPEFPYFFLGYDQWGKMPFDETTRLEQILYLQQNLDRRGKAITEKLENRGKHIWSKDGQLKAEDIEQMDMSNPNEDALVDGNVREVHDFIPPDLPQAPEFEDYNASRERMFSKAGVSASRGEIQTDVATTNQIARESDYNRADELVESTVNELYEWMARWTLHFIKLRYTEDHMKHLLGDDGEVIFLNLNRDMIDDGMEVTISASATDKLKAQQRAQDMATLKLIDPLNYYKDIGASDPQGRTEALMLFMQSPATYMQKYVKQLSITEMAQAVGQPDMQDQSMQPGMPSDPNQPAPNQPGMPPQPPMGGPEQPSPMNTQQVPAQPPTGPAPGSTRIG